MRYFEYDDLLFHKDSNLNSRDSKSRVLPITLWNNSTTDRRPDSPTGHIMGISLFTALCRSMNRWYILGLWAAPKDAANLSCPVFTCQPNKTCEPRRRIELRLTDYETVVIPLYYQGKSSFTEIPHRATNRGCTYLFRGLCSSIPGQPGTRLFLLAGRRLCTLTTQ